MSTPAVKNLNRALDAAREAAADDRDYRGVGGIVGSRRRKVAARRAGRRASKAVLVAAVCGDY
jgi:hypothetical protein